jgi:two-component system NtrC family response regulator
MGFGEQVTAMPDPNLLSLEEVDRRHIMKVIDHCHGNRTNAAQLLAIDRKTLYRKLLRWGVEK